ncbi:protein FAR1-RELATED SEQUENCE 3-like [Vigna unguiculata]|uniref:protein FAR1-RELATED SEQUENCE 3-like n=1 Tax=Vigna unguiculata TaxID=3917 RepID=UPI001016F7E3|nr:protein FAR1-RELATED SEQUENCE 3-like [Vigna unguiculata]
MNNDFYFEIDFDDNNRISNVFWADAHSRAACEEFGDVVSFDTTYLTNKYDMPFAPFVGVNHHDKSPDGILTDQCRAMQNAIDIFRGIVCRHYFTVFGQEKATTILTKYIIPRWSKLIRRRYTSMRAAYNTHSKDPTMQRYRALCKEFFQIVDVACESDAGTE